MLKGLFKTRQTEEFVAAEYQSNEIGHFHFKNDYSFKNKVSKY
jgi:hypothetical protein